MVTSQMEFDRQKEELRRKMREIRDSIPDEVREEENKTITKIILHTELYETASCILSYVSFGSEVDTKELIRQAIRDGKRVYVPKVLPHGKMDFFLCEDLSLLVRNEKGILEPEANPARLFPYTTHISLDSAENCMILVPGLAFDAKLGRIGYGAGYYDRYLSGFCKKMTIGMAFKEQIVEEVPMGQDDIPMDLVVTPERAYF